MENYSVDTPSVGVAPVKILGLAETADEKNLNYYRSILEKKLQYEAAKARKEQDLFPPTPEEFQDAEEFQRISELNTTFLDSYRKNKDAWFDTSSFTGQLANTFLAVGTGALTHLGLGATKSIFSTSNILTRQQINDEEFQRSKDIRKKLDTNIPLSPEEETFTKSLAYKRTQGILFNERVFQSLNELSLKIKSVVNTLPTDMAKHRYDQRNDVAIEYFKEGTVSGVLTGLGTFFGNIATMAFEDPYATILYAADAIPYMIAHVKVPGVAIPVYASNAYEEAMQEFQQEYQRHPDRVEQAFSLSLSTLSAILDSVGAKGALLGKGIFTSILQTVKTTGVKVVPGVLEKIASTLRKAGIDIAQTVFTEATTEGSQEVLESLAAKHDISKVSPRRVLGAATVGGVVGGVIATPGSAVRVTADEKVKEYTKIIKKYAATPEFKLDNETGYSGAEAVALMKRTVKLKDPKKRANFTKALITDLLKTPNKDTGKHAKKALELIFDNEIDKDISKETISILKDLSRTEEGTVKKAVEKALPVSETLVTKGKKQKDVTKVIQGKLDIYTRDNKSWNTKERETFRKDIQKDIIVLEEEVTNLPEETTKQEATKAIKEKALSKYTALYNSITGVPIKADLSPVPAKELEEHTQQLAKAEEKLKTTAAKLTKSVNKLAKNKTDTESKRIVLGSMSEFLLTKEDAEKIRDAEIFEKGSEQASRLDEYINAVTFPEVTTQIKQGKGKNQFTKGINYYMDGLTAAFANKDNNSAKRHISQLVSWYNHHSTKADRDEIWNKDVIAQNKKEYEFMAKAIVNAHNAYKSIFKKEFKIDPRYLKHFNGKLVRGLTKKHLGSRDINEGVKQAQAVKAKQQEPTKTQEEVPKGEKTSSKFSKPKEPTPAKEAKSKSKPTIALEKDRDYYTKELEEAVKADVLSPKETKLATSIIEGFKKYTKDIPAKAQRLVFQASSIIRKATAKTNILLRSRLFRDSITINTTSTAARKGIKYPKSLRELVIADKGIVGSLLQEYPNLLNKSIEEIAEVLNISVSEFSENEVKALAYLKVLHGSYEALFNDYDSILRDINPKNVTGKFTDIPYDLDVALRDVTSYLIQEDSTGHRYLDSDLLGVLAVVGMEWLATQGMSTLFNTPEDIANLVGLNVEDIIGTDINTKLARAGVPRALIERMVGGKAFELLEWRLHPEYKDNAWIVSKLKIALGQLITTGLLSGNVLEENKVKLDDLLGKQVDESTQDFEFKDTKFLQLQHEDYVPIKSTENLIKTFTEGKKSERGINLIHDKFGVKTNETGPTFTKPKKQKERTIKGEFRKVSKETNEFIDNEESKEWKLTTDMWDFHNLFSRNFQTLMMGGKDPAKQHVTQKAITAETNTSLARQFDHMQDFVDTMEDLDVSFFFGYEQWKPGRIGIRSNTVNPLSSKFHRAVISKASWNVDADMNNTEHYEGFVTAIAQSLGVDTEKGFDYIEQTLQEILEDSTIIDAIRVIQKSKNKGFSGEFTSEEQQIIYDAVELGGEKYHTLKGLHELSKATQKATAKTKKLNIRKDITFKTDMWLEIDGKTNGVAFSLFQSAFGVKGYLDNRTATLLDACGIFVSGYKNYAEYKANPTNMDIYEIVTNEALPEMLQDANALNLEALSLFLDPFLDEDLRVSSIGRKFSKPIIIRSNFGAGKKSNSHAIIEEQIASIYKYQASLQGKNVSDKEVIAYNRAMQVLTNNNDYTLNPAEATTQEFTGKEYSNLTSNIDNTLAIPLNNAVKSIFGGVDLYKDSLNKGAELLFKLFEVKLDKAILKKREQIKKDIGIERGLLKDEIEEILDSMPEVLPAYKGPHSKELKDYLYALTITKAKEYNTADAQQQFYSRGIANTEYSSTDSKESHSTVTHAPVVSLRDAGIKTLIKMIHHMDSTVQQRLMMQHDVLGIHDAHVGNILNISGRGQFYNELFFDVNKNYHGLTELLNRIKEVVKEGKFEESEAVIVNTHIKNSGLTFGTIKKKSDFPIKASFNTVRDVINYLEQINQMSYEARQKVLDLTQYYDQYIGLDSVYSPQQVKLAEEDVLKAINEQLNILGSDPDTSAIDLNNFDTVYESDITPLTTQLIFEELGKYEVNQESKSHTDHLQHLLTDLINNVIRPIKDLKVKLEEKGNLNRGKIVDDKTIYLKAAPSKPALQIGQSIRSIWMHEMIHAVSREGLDMVPAIRRQVYKLMRLAEKYITPEDLLEMMDDKIVFKTSEKGEKFVAEELWNYIFRSENSIHEFMAHGLTNEKFRKKLREISVEVTIGKAENILEALANFWKKIIEQLSNLFYKTEGKTVDKALESLLFQLNTAKDRRTADMKYSASFRDNLDIKTKSVLNKYIFQPYLDLSRKHLEDSNITLAKALSLPAGIAQLINHKDFYLMIEEVKRRIGWTHDNFLVKLIREIFVGETEDNSRWHNLLREAKKFIDQARQQKAKIVEQYIKGNFKTGLSRNTSETLQRTLVKPDISGIIASYDPEAQPVKYTYTIDQITEFLVDENALENEIKSIEADIDKGPEGAKKYYKIQAAHLGKFMVTGETTLAESNLNVHNIVNMAGVHGKLKKLIHDEKTITKQLEALSSLYGLLFTTSEDKYSTARKIKAEFAADKEKNGITAILDSHKLMKERAADRIFNGPSLITKGYTSSIINQKVDIQVAPLAEKKEMERNGYLLHSNIPVTNDTDADPNKIDMYMYVTKEAAKYERIRTMTSITNKRHKGTSVPDIYEALGDPNPYVAGTLSLPYIQQENLASLKKQFNTDMDIRNLKGNYFVPIRNNQGNTAGYRYMMKHDVLRTLFEQEERVEKVLAATEASILDKERTGIINNKVVDAAYDDYTENASKIPSHFKLVALDSPDGEKYSELYRLLPEDMRKYMELKWKGKGMMVREEFVDLIFGFRKASLYDAKIYNLEIGKIMNQSLLWFTRALTKAFPKINYKGTLPLKAIEDKLQDAVGIAKDLIVVKSGQVLVDNAISNTILLWTKGVPITKVFSLQKEAFNAIEDYRNLLEEKDLVKQELESTAYRISSTKKKNLEAKVTMLESEIKANPATELVQEGLFQSIIEDIDLDEKVYNSSSKLARYAEDWGNKHLKDFMMTGVKYAWMAKDTPIYKLLFKLTQYGDFIARYALYTHRVREKGIEKKDEIIREVVETFINYDVPTSPELQYLNDMGLFMFSKFLFRIQRVIFKTFKERPASTLSFLLMQHVTGLNPADINESAFFSGLLYRVGSPFRVIREIFQIPITNFRL